MKAVTPTLVICLASVSAAIGAAAADLGGPASPRTTYGGTATIAIQDFAFSAALVTPGAEVVVHNVDSAPHSVTADDGSFDSDVVDGGADGSFTAPETPGTYDIHCVVHPSMTGTVVVARP